MFKLPLQVSFAAIALAVLANTPATAQGLGNKLATAEQKLSQDIKDCKVNPAEYAELLKEAVRNKQHVTKLIRDGVPVAPEQAAEADAAFHKAGALFNQAHAALGLQCARQAQGQAQTTPDPAATPAQLGSGSAPGTTSEIIADAEKTLDADIKAGKRVNPDEYEALLKETLRNLKAADKASKAGVPVDSKKLIDDYRRAQDLYDRARKVAIYQPLSPPKPDMKEEPKPPANQSMNLNPFEKTMLAIHNAMRAKYGAAPLEWAPGMAVGAAAWAGTMAQTGRVEHSPREGRGTDRENLARAPANYSDAQIIDGWVSEEAEFVPGTFPNVCRSGGACEGVLHIAQMIWPTTIRIGCGKAVGKGGQYVVCRYGPGGNKPGKMVGIPPATNLADAGSKLEQPALPPAEVFNSSIRPRPIGGDYTGGKAIVAQGQQPKVGPEYGEHEMVGRTAPLFDLGIYAGGAYSTDWFEVGAPPLADDEYWGASAGIIAKLGDDLSAEVGGRHEDFDFAGGSFGNGIYWDPISQVTVGPGANYVDALPATGPGELSNPTKCTGSQWLNAYRWAEDNYDDAQARGDPGAMMIAKAEMANAILGQFRAWEAAGEAGELSAVSPSQLSDSLAEMIKVYASMTNEPAPVSADPEAGFKLSGGISPGRVVDQPKLPPTEVFNPADAPKCTLDVM